MSSYRRPVRVPVCRHCHRCVAKRRGLCYAHYYDKEVRAMYAPVARTADGRLATDPEPTEAELDLMIAEQMMNLPDWWDSAYPEDD